jgi:PAS domain S-box-containing protein
MSGHHDSAGDPGATGPPFYRRERHATPDHDVYGGTTQLLAAITAASPDEALLAGLPLGAILEQMPVGVIIAEAPSGRVLTYNRRAAEPWGGIMPGADSIADYAVRYLGMRADGSHYRAEDFPLARAVRHGETVLDEEIEFRMPTGEERVLLVSAAPIRDAAGEIRAAVGLLADVTQRRRDERRREFLARIGSTFRTQGDPEELMRTAATALGERLGASSVMLADTDAELSRLRVHVEYRNGVAFVSSGLSVRHIGASLVAELRAGRVVAIEDIAAHPLVDDDGVEMLMARETRSLLAVPVVRGEAIVGVVLVSHVAPRRWSRDDIALVAQLGDRAWAAHTDAMRHSSLQMSQEWLRVALRAGSAAAWEWDLATDRLSWSGEHHALLGTAETEPIATSDAFMRIVHEEDQPRLRRLLRRMGRVGGTREVGMEIRIVRSTGETRWVRLQGHVLLGRNGRPRRAYGVLLDVTQRKEAELGREALLRQLHAANLAKSNFISVISHEFRTPLTSVIGYSELLASGAAGELSPRQAQQLSRIKASAWHLTQVIDEVLTFSRLEAGHEEVQRARVDVTAVARDAIAVLEPHARSRDLELTAELPDSLVLDTDEGKLRQILINLLGNAVKFTNEGSVRLTVRRDHRRIVVEVADTGIGIAREHLDRIFERFWQVNQGSTRRHGGTGLGLTVTKRLTELLGGTIRVESEPGIGSTFRVEFGWEGPA